MNETVEKSAMLKRFSFFVTSVCGLGFIKLAPGTISSLAAILVTALILFVGSVQLLAIVVLIVIIVGYLASAVALRYSDEKDPAFIVIDEFGAQMGVFIIPVLLFPSLTLFPGLYVLGFALFRFFDIAKPLNVGVVDRNLSGALGVMLDDILAAFYSTLILTVVMWIYTLVMKNPAVSA